MKYLWALLTLAFDTQIAHRNLQIAASTYCDKTEIDGLSIIGEIRADTNIIIGDDAVQGARVFSFRGSSDIYNWISNIEFEFTEPYADKSIKVHRGLYAEYATYKDRLMEHLAPNLILNGHSSGAALAMFFAYDISQANTNTNVTVYTYGKPRIGNAAFAESVSMSDIIHYRITHHDDIVPHLPEEIFGYRHTDSEVWFYDDSDNYAVCSGGEDPECSNSCAPTKCTSTSDHMYYMMTNIGSDYCVDEL